MAYSREEVRQALEVLRRGTASHGSCLHLIRKANFTLADIGTSEEELEQLRIKGCKTAAQTCLDDLREGSIEYRLHLSKFRELVRQGGLTLAEFPTSEVELESLRIKGCKTSATYFLEKLRPGVNSWWLFLSCLRRECTEGRFTFAVIGTSEEELEQLRIKGCKTAAQMCLEHLRRGSDRDVVFLEQLRKQLRLGDLSLADIGTNAAELASFERRTSAA